MPAICWICGQGIAQGIRRIAVGHSILKLIEILGTAGLSIPEEIKNSAKYLDMHYIPTRYPDAYTAGAPFEFYDEKTAQFAINNSRTVIDFVKKVKEEYA